MAKAYIDKIYTAHPFYGYRRICRVLNNGHALGINYKAVLRHMHEMGIQAIYPRQDTSRPRRHIPEGLKIHHPDHVWPIDITYIPVQADWLYLVAIIDWFSRYVVSWETSVSMEIDFVLDTRRKALKNAIPEIMNSDQGSHFTSPKYTQIFLDADSKISMGHRGRAYDNIFVERLWRSVK